MNPCVSGFTSDASSATTRPSWTVAFRLQRSGQSSGHVVGRTCRAACVAMGPILRLARSCLQAQPPSFERYAVTMPRVSIAPAGRADRADVLELLEAQFLELENKAPRTRVVAAADGVFEDASR